MMKAVWKTVILALAVTCAVADRNADTEEDETNVGLREKIIIASYGTTTYTEISTKTTVMPYTCYTTKAQACQGRRFRRRQRATPILEEDTAALEATDLDTSKELPGEEAPSAEMSQKERLVFTVWQTTTTTATITTTSVNRSITISASAYCTYTGFTGPVC
ncbi:uncharacterized protein LOC135203995 [Macrobrachium nipponense]|uniref:uncharacterized protein LOC135203995 n=1 Tax=Macrobrachium nipponense TaxID=159736 RepID=UPI0030C7E88E